MTIRVCVVIRLVPGPVSRLQPMETVGISAWDLSWQCWMRSDVLV